MSLRYAVAVILALALLHLCGDLAGEPTAPRANGDDNALDDPTQKGDRLRHAGFLFLELDVRDTADHAAFFKSVAGFDVNRKQGSFVILRSARGEILLNGVAAAKDAKPVRYQGPRVEIGIVVDDLDKAYAEAKQRRGWTLQGGIARQPWNARDFRVYSPDGYYFRITEGPK